MPSPSAAFNRSPFLSVDHPLSYAVHTSCPTKASRNGTGTPWSKRIALSVDGGTAGGVFEDLANLIETDAGKQGNKLIDGNAVLEILE
jgi:hypothetical protein